MRRGRASVDRLIARTREFLDALANAPILPPSDASMRDAVDRALWRMQHAATLEKVDRMLRYDLCRHLYPNGYCVDCERSNPAHTDAGGVVNYANCT